MIESAEFVGIRRNTRDFTHIRYEQYGLSYLDLWTLPALWCRSRAQRIRMAFSNIDREGIKGMKGNRNVGTKDAFDANAAGLRRS